MQTPADLHQAPLARIGDGQVGIGPDVRPRAPLRAIPGHPGAEYGAQTDGIGQEELVEYLHQEATDSEGDYAAGHIWRFSEQPPQVLLNRRLNKEQTHAVVQAVQIINAALPTDWQLSLHETNSRPTTGLNDTGIGNLSIVFKAPRISGPLAVTDRWTIRTTGEIRLGRIEISPSLSGSQQLGVLVHEMLHALGRHHADNPQRFTTIMRPRISLAAPPQGYILHPLDREALQAVYSRFQADAAPEQTTAQVQADLGPWSDTSTHLLQKFTVNGATISYGVASRNGLHQPWAQGPEPGSLLGNNLSGTALWSGKLWGYTPQQHSVHGDAGLSIDISTLTGQMEFTRLQSWPGQPGNTGTPWQDGDLSYSVLVEGNTFRQQSPSPDTGTLTGAFFGTEHQGMAGVLQRDDLSAGFGGARQ